MRIPNWALRAEAQRVFRRRPLGNEPNLDPTSPGLGNQGRDVVSAFGDNDLREDEAQACRPACRPEEHALARVVTVWPKLTDEVRAAILTLVKAAARRGREA